MDSTLVAAVISALGAAAATAGGAVLRTRASARTAARLIYAELTKNSAAVKYFRHTGSWVAPALSRAAWEEYGVTIARRRSSASFELVHRGYDALEIVPALAEGSLSGVRVPLLEDAVKELKDAITELGKIAHISSEQVEKTLAPFDGSEAPTAESRPEFPALSAGTTSLILLDRLTAIRALPLPTPLSDIPVALLERLVSERLDAEQPEAEHIVYDAGQQESVERLTPLRWDGKPPTGDPAVDEAYEGLVAVTTFGREVLGREPLAERPLIAFVHYGTNFNNALWDGYQLVLGDGDGEVFNRFSQCLDVIGGEIWHGVPEMLHNFDWEGEHGALHASLCDVFGQLIKQYTLGQSVEEADWLLGSGLLASGINGLALRSMKDPGAAYNDRILGEDPQPAHMDNYVHTSRDKGGVHINNGIPNRAFYLVAERLGGKAWERAGRIWWDALTGDGMRRGLLFADWAHLTAESARTRYGRHSIEHEAVLAAWNDVGVPASN
ncbi:hypothetical protein GCM10011579_019760 [Streptomyces albiflavescens]|uniref:Neutral metalloproteinase n=1 Tax=Streptomyces albiflavescens TaxID=1623582 RepID=A0A917XXH9_9ACTN|nr:M4 family metallopeptidase [Streptomyces albiflavescens]GGN57466.1 hypothetical protein GCM10011579_019760 [Streptomyces albiflavescens]